MIEKLLEANFLTHIGDDQTKLDYINTTVSHLVSQIEKQPLKLIPFTLIALDPQTNPEEKLFLDVENELKRHWTTYHNKFMDGRPIQLLRAIIIESLSQLANKKDAFAAIIWYTGSNYIIPERLQNEIEILRGFLTEVGEKVEAKAKKQWLLTFDHGSVKKIIEGSDKEAHPVSLNTGELKNSFSTLWDETTNSITAKSSSGAATSVGNLLETAVNQFQKNVEKNNNELKKLVSIEILKNQLFWWKESKYSENLKKSYREIDIYLLIVSMAYDLHSLITEIHPHSVEHFLKENLLQINQTESKISVYDFTEKLLTVLKKEEFVENNPIAMLETFEGRNSLVGLIKFCFDKGEVTKDDIVEILGLEYDKEFSLTEYIVWIFRDMQALRLARTLSSTRRKR